MKDERVSVFIDGFNLDRSIRGAGLNEFLWLDLERLSKHFLQSHQSLVSVHYFTARVKGSGARRRQEAFLQANAKSPKFDVHYGEMAFYTSRCSTCHDIVRCVSCDRNFAPPLEKQSDVNLGTLLAIDALRDRFDIAIVVSSDSDFIGAIRLVSEECPDKQILVALPPGRYEIGKPLAESAKAYVEIWPSTVEAVQLPDPVILGDSRKVRKPADWS